MTLDFESFNVWAVLVGHLIFMVLGALWYSPVLFGKLWMEERQIKPEDISVWDANRSMALSNLPTLGQVVVIQFLIILTGAASLTDGLFIGLLTGFGAVGLFVVNSGLFENKSVRYGLITLGYPTVAHLVTATMMAVWR